MDNMIRLMVAGDHPPLGKGVLALIETTPDIELVGEAADGVETVA